MILLLHKTDKTDKIVVVDEILTSFTKDMHTHREKDVLSVRGKQKIALTM